MSKIGFALIVVIVGVALLWKSAKHAPVSAPAPVATATRTTNPAASQHVTQFANAAQRAELEHRIEEARQAKHVVTAQLPTPEPKLPSAPALAADELDHQTIKSAMHEVIPYITDCYTQELPALGSATTVSIKAHFTITGDRDVGAIIDAKQIFDDSGKPLSPKFDNCLRTTLQTLQLPPLGDGSSVEVDYPLLFSND